MWYLRCSLNIVLIFFKCIQNYVRKCLLKSDGCLSGFHVKAYPENTASKGKIIKTRLSKTQHLEKRKFQETKQELSSFFLIFLQEQD